MSFSNVSSLPFSKAPTLSDLYRVPNPTLEMSVSSATTDGATDLSARDRYLQIFGTAREGTLKEHGLVATSGCKESKVECLDPNIEIDPSAMFRKLQSRLGMMPREG
uniref:Uncharacterized protein n=1 Tax=Kwoniella bestiolae CBS 10118 TaxID=1296100 RepID=A0A1B9G9C6_9TREE|nr:hypothetical protein I302_02462 [Kwoniella bestiolae CBS 10118]OCF27619.1 hypothetical protein I302_02462 [Kwoniella bestiolae CBS 10118]